ncbi:MATE family efflux transporter [Paracoccus suum]|uniref:MATE family efflux transporter n=2 Tax=Paracoccus suum TaxID=2259340 RepID=A0A344PNR6_9RHOB|nr:MATE family efflux transporter [Paracoccus suum]AXC51021.1 MATE family efflux transporter [Paracoccus suum]
MPLTNRRVLAVAVPIVLSNATIPLLGVVDTGVIGQLGSAAPIGAVGMGAVILASIYWVFSFLRMGTTGLVAQAHGAGRNTGVHLMRALVIGLGAGALFIATQWLWMRAAFALSPASPEVEALARQYLQIRIWGAPATIALYAVNGWLIGAERTRAVMVLQLVITVTNIVLALWFVLGLAWGVPGVAAATLVAEWAGLALGLWLARHAIVPALRRADLFARDQMVRFARVNSDIMVRSILLQGAVTAFMFLGAGLGDVTLAANQVLLQFLQITAYALDGFAFAAETLVGQAVGAGRPASVRRAAVLTSQWALAGAALLAVAFWVGGGPIIDLLTVAPDVRGAAREYLPWLAAVPLVGVAAWMLDGVFIGATLTAEMRRAMMAAVGLYVVAVVVLMPVMGNHGLWAALTILNLTRAVMMYRLYPAAERAALANA